jgi:hypothetical protein
VWRKTRKSSDFPRPPSKLPTCSLTFAMIYVAYDDASTFPTLISSNCFQSCAQAKGNKPIFRVYCITMDSALMRPEHAKRQ